MTWFPNATSVTCHMSLVWAGILNWELSNWSCKNRKTARALRNGVVDELIPGKSPFFPPRIVSSQFGDSWMIARELPLPQENPDCTWTSDIFRWEGCSLDLFATALRVSYCISCKAAVESSTFAGSTLSSSSSSSSSSRDIHNSI